MYLPYITVIRTNIDLLTILLGSLCLFKPVVIKISQTNM